MGQSETVVKGHDFSRAVSAAKMKWGFSPCGMCYRKPTHDGDSFRFGFGPRLVLLYPTGCPAVAPSPQQGAAPNGRLTQR